MRDAVIIGAGHNGLVAAAVLARAGMKPLVLEASEQVGGCARTSDIAPGFRGPTLAHRIALDPLVLRALNLSRHGLEIIRPEALICAPTVGGRALTLWADAGRAAADVARFSPHDAENYPRFLESLRAVGGVVRSLLSAPRPSIHHTSGADLIELLKAGRRFRALGRADAYRLLRWLPMPAADLVGESFESEPLCAALAAGGLLGSFLGPREAGSGAILLLLASRHEHPVGAGWTVRGGPGALADALAAAARDAGAEIRCGAAVRHILVRDEAAAGVVLEGGEEIPARAVLSNADPKRTLLTLIDPVHLAPDFLQAVRTLRTRGTLAKVNYALSEPPRFSGLAALDDSARTAALSGVIRLARDTSSIERAFGAAKYGRFSDEPWIELTIPSMSDPALAPAGRHVASAYVQYAPYALRDTNWDAERDRLGDVATRTIARYAPGFEAAIVSRQVLTPLDLERSYRLTGGHIFHGELALDQLFVARPLIGHARYATPIRGLYLCGAGTHPGTGLDGRSGLFAAREVMRARR